jgi:hypothetical protein
MLVQLPEHEHQPKGPAPDRRQPHRETENAIRLFQVGPLQLCEREEQDVELQDEHGVVGVVPSEPQPHGLEEPHQRLFAALFYLLHRGRRGRVLVLGGGRALVFVDRGGDHLVGRGSVGGVGLVRVGREQGLQHPAEQVVQQHDDNDGEVKASTPNKVDIPTIHKESPRRLLPVSHRHDSPEQVRHERKVRQFEAGQEGAQVGGVEDGQEGEQVEVLHVVEDVEHLADPVTQDHQHSQDQHHDRY